VKSIIGFKPTEKLFLKHPYNFHPSSFQQHRCLATPAAASAATLLVVDSVRPAAASGHPNNSSRTQWQVEPSVPNPLLLLKVLVILVLATQPVLLLGVVSRWEALHQERPPSVDSVPRSKTQWVVAVPLEVRPLSVLLLVSVRHKIMLSQILHNKTTTMVSRWAEQHLALVRSETLRSKTQWEVAVRSVPSRWRPKVLVMLGLVRPNQVLLVEDNLCSSSKPVLWVRSELLLHKTMALATVVVVVDVQVPETCSIDRT
jgi:hypothetical protein